MRISIRIICLPVMAACLWAAAPGLASAADLQSDSYLGITLGNQDAASLARMQALFGPLHDEYAEFCLKGNGNYAIVAVEKDTKHGGVRVLGLTLSSRDPGSHCVAYPDPLPAVSGLAPGMKYADAVFRLVTTGYHRTANTARGGAYEKRIVGAASCQHIPASDFELEHYRYGSDVAVITYHLRRNVVDKLVSVEKTIDTDFEAGDNADCEARNKALH